MSRRKFFAGISAAILSFVAVLAAKKFNNPRVLYYCTVSTPYGFCVPVIRDCNSDVTGSNCVFSFVANGGSFSQQVYSRAVFTHGGHALPCFLVGNCSHPVIYLTE